MDATATVEPPGGAPMGACREVAAAKLSADEAAGPPREDDARLDRAGVAAARTEVDRVDELPVRRVRLAWETPL